MAIHTRVVQAAFSVGQLDRLMLMRSDIGDYLAGLKTCSDFALLVQGAARRRPGTRYKATARVQTAPRLIPFVFSSAAAYVLWFTAGNLDIYNTDGTILQSGIAVPFTLQQIQQMTWDLAGGTMILAHKDVATQRLLYSSGSGASPFTLTQYDTLISTDTAGNPLQPYFKYATGTTTLALSATSGNGVTLTLAGASAGTLNNSFLAGHVGTWVRYGTNATPVSIKITAVSSTTVATGNIIGTAAAATAAVSWDEQAWSPVHGYARAVAFHENRLLFAGARDLPTGFWATQSAAFFNWDVGTGQDSQAIWTQWTNSAPITEIRHIIAQRHLLILGDLAEGWVPLAPQTALTPSNCIFKRSSKFGSGYVRPSLFDANSVFVQVSGAAVRESSYQYFDNNYTADAISNRSADLIISPVDLAVLPAPDPTAGRPEEYIFVLNSDGSLAVFHGVKAEKLAGWVPWYAAQGGQFVGIAILNAEVYVGVRRNGVYLLELFDWSAMLDCSVALAAGTAQTTWSGFPWLNGLTVSTVSNAALYYGDYVASGGSLTLSSNMGTGPTQLDVGLNFQPVFEILPPDANEEANRGHSATQWRRLPRGEIVVDSSLSVRVAGQELVTRHVTDDLSLPPTPATGAFSFAFLGYSRRPTVKFTQDVPLPLTILGVSIEVVR